LWQALRERANQIYGKQDLPDMDIPEEVLAVPLGIKESDVPYVED
jgi:hypothetical protein